MPTMLLVILKTSCNVMQVNFIDWSPQLKLYYIYISMKDTQTMSFFRILLR